MPSSNRKLRLIRFAVGEDSLLAEGDPAVPAQRARIAAAFRRQIEAGRYAVVPSLRLDACCRRGLVVEHFSEVPPDAESVVFFQRNNR